MTTKERAALRSVPENSPDNTAATAPGAVSPALPNILIVDDRQENLLATEKVLKRLDANLFKACSGPQALSLILRHRFALVLLDVQMPGMDGFETAKLMKEHESMSGVPIIFATALGNEERYAARAAEIGAVDYIFKPINPDILRSKLQVYLDLYDQRAQIVRLNENLSRSNEELERFAYICSHDMQEPVRMMSSFAELVEEEYRGLLDETGRKYLSFIADNARHMQKMIHDILAFSRVGREGPQSEPVDCGRLVGEVLEEFAPAIAEHKARIAYDNLPVIAGSPSMLHMLFQNLIGNALKFHSKGQAPEITVAARRQENHWLFSVRDNGIGIAPEYKERVFVIFQRLHRREEYPGTGIGLSACKKFVEICGGKIWFDSTPGKGSVFYFTVPAE